MKTSTVDAVVEIILNQLKLGTLKPGGRLPSQRRLAASLGVSRSTIREALNTLAGMGHLFCAQGKGTFVHAAASPAGAVSAHPSASFPSGSILELMEARELLESKSAELAALRGRREEFGRIRKAVREIGRSGDDVSHFFNADLEFHLAVAKASGNQTIFEMVEVLIQKVLSYHKHFRATSSPEVRASTHKTACRLMRHLARGDGAQAAEEMRRHLNLVSAQLRQIMQDIAPVLAGPGERRPQVRRPTSR
ncbi:MAG: FCD domain-containing protein [Desulfobacterales bacterium]|jgi:DNA-binding FadR family transcriptional regulator|nr:FCD domain-containing protein [Desulfobacterales bacterium]